MQLYLEIQEVYKFDDLLVNTKYCMRIQINPVETKYYGIPSEPICFESKLKICN